MLIELIPKIGQRAVFINELGKLKEHKEVIYLLFNIH